jgi:cell division topological specificity factor
MNLLRLLNRRTSALVARERLQVLLTHERRIMSGKPDLVSLLREEILAVIAKHLAVDSKKFRIRMEQGDACSTLAVDVEVPTISAAAA